MKSFLILLAAQLFCAAQLWPAGLNTLSPDEDEAGWLLLFDGKTTDGWTGLNDTPFPDGHWVVEDGCLKTVTGSYRADIVTKQLFNDFEFSYEWKVPPGGNSGVKYQLLNYPAGIPDLIRNNALKMAVIFCGLAPDSIHAPDRRPARRWQAQARGNRWCALGHCVVDRVRHESNLSLHSHKSPWLRNADTRQFRAPRWTDPDSSDRSAIRPDRSGEGYGQATR
jgi:hypothetical protein